MKKITKKPVVKKPVVKPEPKEASEPWSEGEYVDWMDTNGLERSEDWISYRGIVKGFCDVLTLKDVEVGPCLLPPRNGFFMRVDGMENVPTALVQSIRMFVDQKGIRDEEEEDESGHGYPSESDDDDPDEFQ